MKYTEQIIFILSCGLVFWQAWGLSYDSQLNYKKGLCAVIFVIFIESLLKGEIIFFQRYNAFWRACLRVALLYMCGLVFLAFQNEKDARQLITYIYPELGKPLNSEFHTYDDNCDWTWENIFSNFDHYYAIHLFDWFCCTLIVRDRWIMHMWHIFDEVIELSFQHILPHFAECAYDHLIIDILLSNIPAVEFGLFVIDKLGWKKYDWFGTQGTSSIKEWDVWYNARRFGGWLQIIGTVTVNFLCGFFLINSLWIPPVNSFNIFRLIIWFLTSNMAFRELYNDIETWNTVERINNPVSGKARWITLFLLISEVYVSIKFLKDAGNWNEDFVTPFYIWFPWTFLIVVSLIYYLYLRNYGIKKTKYPQEYYEHKEINNCKKVAKQKVVHQELQKKFVSSDKQQQQKKKQ